MDTPLVLTLLQAAKALQISESAARKLAAEGTLPVVKLGSRLSRVPVAALNAQLAAVATPKDEAGTPEA